MRGVLIADDRGWLDQNNFFRYDFVLAAIAADLAVRDASSLALGNPNGKYWEFLFAWN